MNVWKLASGMYKSGFGMTGKYFGLGLSNRFRTVSVYSRTMWHMGSVKSNPDNKFLKLKPVSESYQSSCSSLLHTTSEQSLVDFLQTEITEERKVQKMAELPKEVNGFSIEVDGAELTFKKQNKNETVIVSMNINHSLDSVDPMDSNEETVQTKKQGKDGTIVVRMEIQDAINKAKEAEQSDDYTGEMRSKPSFEVDITRNNKTLSFSCSFVSFMDTGEEKADVYQIDEVTVFEGEWNEKNYSVAGDILDEDLYDLFMSLLHEKGITNEFVEEVSEVATFYEHSKYITLLEEIKKFSSAN